MTDKLPEWAMEMAWGVFGPYPKAVVRTPQRKLLVLGIARALVDAERRGRSQGHNDARRTARRAFMAMSAEQRANADLLDDAIYIAIRNLGVEEC